eukprot:283259_1
MAERRVFVIGLSDTGRQLGVKIAKGSNYVADLQDAIKTACVNRLQDVDVDEILLWGAGNEAAPAERPTGAGLNASDPLPHCKFFWADAPQPSRRSKSVSTPRSPSGARGRARLPP